MDISVCTQKLPLGLYAKRLDLSLSNEPHALDLLERHAPSVPAPLLIDTFQGPDGRERFIMTAVPGERLADVFYRMSYAERNKCADDLAEIVDRIRRIPNTTEYRFANTLGGPITDHRATSTQCGPFYTEDEFNRHLTKGIGSVLKKKMLSMQYNDHRSVFTHSDFWMTNILVNRGRLSGIVDWECAGYMPEYWEFTKAIWGVSNNEDGEIFFWKVFGDKYKAELEAERVLWPLFPFGGPDGNECSSTSSSGSDSE